VCENRPALVDWGNLLANCHGSIVRALWGVAALNIGVVGRSRHQRSTDNDKFSLLNRLRRSPLKA